MIKLFKNYNKRYLQLIGLHAAIGFAIYLFRFLGLFYFLGSIIFFVIWTFQTKNKNNQALLAAAYMTAGEVFFRMTGGSIIPWEAGKYSVICFILIGLFFSGTSRKSAPYWLYLILLIPGVIYAAETLNFDTNVRKAVIFNLSGPFCLGISALYCYDRRITRKQLHNVVWCLLMPVIALSIYLLFFTPDTRDVLNGTQSNFALSGGYGPNQVSTALGIGMFALVVQLFVNSRNKLIFFINLGLLMFLAYRGIITFSRGGVLTAALISIAFIVMYFQGVSGRKRNAISFYLVIIGGAIAITWLISSVRTMGLIDLRYANKDAAGRIKEDLSTGREELITSELTFFVNNPILGIGVGKTKEYREEKLDILAASHNEISRLLSEHGVFGLLALFILVLTPLFFRIGNRNNYLFYSFYGFWFLTINHSSMRVAAPAFIYALALLNVINEKKNTLSRQQISP